MKNYKLLSKENIEKILYFIVLTYIVINAYFTQDSKVAMISAICGISYTFFAGKGKPYCYLFGITGSSFYCMISWQNALWGNLLLYALYYIPMQFVGYFSWNKNLKSDKNEIIKSKLSKKELLMLCILLSSLSVVVYFLLLFFQDSHPILDSITTVFSIGGMYLTVKRAIEQWILWGIVNMLSIVMWLNVAFTGAKVYSTIIMWVVYLILAIYFFIEWKRELNKLNVVKM